MIRLSTGEATQFSHLFTVSAAAHYTVEVHIKDIQEYLPEYLEDIQVIVKLPSFLYILKNLSNDSRPWHRIP
jgi:hypothetical protein